MLTSEDVEAYLDESSRTSSTATNLKVCTKTTEKLCVRERKGMKIVFHCLIEVCSFADIDLFE